METMTIVLVMTNIQKWDKFAGWTTRSAVRYYIDYPHGRMHVLNEKSLQYQLKNYFGIKGAALKGLMTKLADEGRVELQREVKAS